MKKEKITFEFELTITRPDGTKTTSTISCHRPKNPVLPAPTPQMFDYQGTTQIWDGTQWGYKDRKTWHYEVHLPYQHHP